MIRFSLLAPESLADSPPGLKSGLDGFTGRPGGRRLVPGSGACFTRGDLKGSLGGTDLHPPLVGGGEDPAAFGNDLEEGPADGADNPSRVHLKGGLAFGKFFFHIREDGSRQKP